jgi:hypothetical protein
VPWFEPLVDAALIRVCDAETKATVGTGFLTNSDGTVLTCHHVVAARTQLWLEAADGGCTVDQERIHPLPELDLAVLQAPGLGGQPLPLGPTDHHVTRFWTKGYHRIGQQIRSAFPAEGTIAGTAHIMYEQHDRLYELDRALVLEESEFGPGLSGAPLLDPETGVVQAVLSTKWRKPGKVAGYATPIPGAADAPAIQPLIERNRARVPAYGRFFNPAAASHLCKRQLNEALREVAGADQVPLDKHTPRHAAEDAFRSFQADGAPVFALIGTSGSGKSSEAAWLASTYDGPILLLRGATLRAEQRDLAAVVREVLEAIAAPLPLPQDIDQRLPRESARGARSLLVVLDGLNEAPAQLRGLMKDWLWRTTTWLEETGTRLLITCRPEYWEQVRHRFRGLLFQDDQQRPGSPDQARVELGPFSEEEAHQALHVYGLEGTGLTAEDVREPLLVRLYSELATRRGPELPLYRMDVLDEYVRLKCQAVVEATGGSVSHARVRGLLSEVALAMLKRSEDRLDPATYFDLFGFDRSIGERFVDEHLVAPAGRDYRFTLDRVSELLQAETIDLKQVLMPENLLALDEPDRGYRSGSVASALLLAERRAGPDAIREGLQEVVNLFAGRSTPSLALLLDEILPQLRDPASQMDSLVVVAEAMARLPADPNAWPEHSWPVQPDIWRSIRLPLAERMHLLRIMVRSEHGYWWQHNHWRSLDPLMPHSWGGYAALAAECVEASPAEAFGSLVGWLDDDTPLSGGSYTKVSDVAAALLYWYRHLALDQLCDLLGAVGEPTSILTELCADEPAAIARAIGRWVQRGGGQQQLLALDCARRLRWADLRQDDRQRIIEATRGLVTSDSAMVRSNALVVLLREGGPDEAAGDDRVLREALERLLSDDQMVSPYTLIGALRRQPDKVMDAFERYLAEGQDRYRRGEVVLALEDFADDVRISGRGATMALRLLDRRPEHAWEVGRLCELWLSRMTTANPAVIEFAEQLITRGPAKAREPIAYPLTTTTRIPEVRAARQRLLDLLVEQATGEEHAHDLLTLICTSHDLPGRERLVRMLGSRFDPVDFERRLIGIAFMNEEFAPDLAGWLTTGVVPASSPEARRLRKLLERGMNPPMAVRELVGRRGSPGSR